MFISLPYYSKNQHDVTIGNTKQHLKKDGIR